jgi:hypothetical protein
MRAVSDAALASVERIVARAKKNAVNDDGSCLSLGGGVNMISTWNDGKTRKSTCAIVVVVVAD